MQLWPYFLKVHHAINSVTRSTLIESLSRERVREVESFRLTHGEEIDGPFQAAIRDLRKMADVCARNIGDIAAQIALKNKFAELLVFVRLFKRDPTIQKIPETTTPTPDFLIDACRLYIEFKALNAAGGAYTHQQTMEEALKGQISLERQRREGRKVAITYRVHQPWRNPASSRRYDPKSMSYVTEALIEKIAHNLKKEQFSHGRTVLLVDLDQLILPGGKRQLLAREIVSGKTGETHSGVLWHAAFGKPGMAMKRIADFEGEGNKDTPLCRTGILREFKYVQGMIVHYNGAFLGLAIRRKDTLKTITDLDRICDDCFFVNG